MSDLVRATQSKDAALTGRERSLANLKPFQPGESGNPGGRKRSLERRVRELVGDDGDKIASFLLDVLNGRGETLDGQKRKLSDRLEAARILLERAWGSAPIALQTDGEPTKFVLISAFGAVAEDAG